MQTIAATSAASAVGCDEGNEGPSEGAGGAASSGGAGNAAGGAGGTTGGAPGSGGETQVSTGGAADPSGGSGGSSGGAENSGGAAEGSGGNEGSTQLTSPLGIALLGLGSYASGRLAPALQLTEHCRLRGIVTGTPSKIPEWKDRYGIEDKNVYSYENMAELIDNPDIHVVYIVTPNHRHAEFVIAAARAKKHVWCEKPMAMTPEECQTMIDVCNENGVKLAIGYRMQHEPNTQTVIGYASSKPYGAIQQLESLAGFYGFSNGNADVWRLKKAMGGGALFDMGVYSLNAARYATGEEPLRVKSASQWMERADLFSEVDEWTEFELEFPSGVVAFCRTSFGENIDRLEVTCDSGSYWLEPMNSYEGVRGATSDGTQLDQSIENQQARQMDDDALALIENRAMLVPGEEGLRDLRIVKAIELSASTGQPVEL